MEAPTTNSPDSESLREEAPTTVVSAEITSTPTTISSPNLPIVTDAKTPTPDAALPSSEESENPAQPAVTSPTKPDQSSVSSPSRVKAPRVGSPRTAEASFVKKKLILEPDFEEQIKKNGPTTAAMWAVDRYGGDCSLSHVLYHPKGRARYTILASVSLSVLYTLSLLDIDT